MNQSYLYASLNHDGCKILSFEDFPSNQGSWRVCFMRGANNYEVSCNRYDGYMSLKATSAFHGSRISTINCLKFLTDEAELAAIKIWLRSTSNHSSFQNDLIALNN